MLTALPILDNHEDAAFAELHTELVNALLLTGNCDDVLIHADQAIAIATRHNLPQILSRALQLRAYRLSDLGRYTEALTGMTTAIDVAHDNNITREELRSRNGLAVLRSDLDLPGVLDQYELALVLARKIGDRSNEGVCLINIAIMYWWYGNWDEAERHAALAVDAFPHEQAIGFVSIANAFLLILYAMQGRVAETLQRTTTLPGSDASEDIQEKAIILAATATASLAAGEPEAAFQYAIEATELIHNALGTVHEVFRQAWPIAMQAAIPLGRHDRLRELLTLVPTDTTTTVPPYLSAQRLRFNALLAASSGVEDADIEGDMRAAITILGDLGYRYWHARAQLDLAIWLIGIHRTEQATTLLDEAIATGEQLHAQPLVAEANNLLATTDRLHQH